MRPGKEPKRFLRPEISATAGKPVPIEDRPARGIAAENRRKLHLARNQWFRHASILRQPAPGGCDHSHPRAVIFLRRTERPLALGEGLDLGQITAHLAPAALPQYRSQAYTSP